MKNTSLTNNRERFGRKVEETWWYIKKRKMKILRVTFKSGYLIFFLNVRCSPAFLTTDRLRGFALRPLRIPHQGDRIRTYGPLYPKQMRWPDCATPRLTPPGAYRSTRSMNTWTELAHPFGHRDARTNPSNQPFFFRKSASCTIRLFGFLFHLN